MFHQSLYHIQILISIYADGACGYGDLFKQGYGLETTALSKALFNDGLTCGACYQIKCYNSTQWCLDETIQVTATNFCPPNGIRPNENWCDPPRQHFDLSQPMFRKIAKYEAGIVPVLYTRVPCVKQGGVKFHVEGNHDWILVLVYNVGGAGDVTEMKVKVSDNSDWMTMKRNWGQKWQAFGVFVGKGLSFQVSVSDGQMLEFDGVVPDNWQFGSDYEGKDNFHS